MRLAQLLGFVVFAVTSSYAQAAVWSYPPRAWPRWEILRARSYTHEMGMNVGYPVRLDDTLQCATFRDRSGMERTVSASACDGVPCLKGSGYEALDEFGEWIPCDEFVGPEDTPPHLTSLSAVRGTPLLCKGLYEANGETVATIYCRSSGSPVLRVGESREEALNDDLRWFEQSCRMIPSGVPGEWRSAAPLAFRYYRFVSPVEETWFVRDELQAELKGRFSSDDERENRIWQACAKTVRLCTRRFMVDAVKRDRMPWTGDHAIGYLADAATYRNAEGVRFSLDALSCAAHDGFADYSPWWVINFALYRRLYDDADYVGRRWNVLRSRVEALAADLGSDGAVIRRPDRPLFIDWGERGNPTTALNVLFFGAFDAAATLADERGRTDEARRWHGYADRVSDAVMRRAYNPDTGLLYADLAAPTGTIFRQANIHAILFGLVRGERARRIGRTLAEDKLPPVGTTWMIGLESIALMTTGHGDEAKRRIVGGWGGMIDRGFDVAFEHWWPNAQGAASYRYYDRPFGMALCHVAATAPAFLLPRLQSGDGSNPFDVRGGCAVTKKGIE